MKAASFWLHAGKLRLSGYMQESCVFLVTCSPWYNLSGWLGVKHQLLTSGYMQESRVFLVTCRKAASFWLCVGKLASFWLHAGKPCLSGHMQESRVFLVTCWEAMSFWLHAGKLCLLFTWDGPEKRGGVLREGGGVGGGEGYDRVGCGGVCE